MWWKVHIHTELSKIGNKNARQNNENVKMLDWKHHFYYMSGRSRTYKMSICKPDVDCHSFWLQWDEMSCGRHCPATKPMDGWIKEVLEM